MLIFLLCLLTALQVWLNKIQPIFRLSTTCQKTSLSTALFSALPLVILLSNSFYKKPLKPLPHPLTKPTLLTSLALNGMLLRTNNISVSNTSCPATSKTVKLFFLIGSSNSDAWNTSTLNRTETSLLFIDTLISMLIVQNQVTTNITLKNGSNTGFIINLLKCNIINKLSMLQRSLK